MNIDHVNLAFNCYANGKAKEMCELLLCIGMFSRKEIGPLKHFCEVIGKYLFYMR